MLEKYLEGEKNINCSDHQLFNLSANFIYQPKALHEKQ
jgi:hypothetical protein